MSRAAWEDWCRSIQPPSAANPAAVRRHLDDLTKPPGSLGRLESLALRLARVVGDPPPRLEPRAVLVLAGDHGVTAAGVSAYPREVTAQMCRNIARGGAAVSALARSAGVEVVVADLGVARPVDDPGVLDRNVVRATADLSRGPAMTPAQVDAAVGAGAALLDEVPLARMVAVGEMGIGNTTAAAAVTAGCLGIPADQVVGRGTGIDDASLWRKRAAVEAALVRMGPDPGPREILTQAGGAEIAGMMGVFLGAAARGLPVVMDGFISTAAALMAREVAPACAGYLFASHRSTEPGHRLQLEALELDPLLDLDLRLGEGTGAVLAIPLLDAAGAVLREMATFEEAGLSGPGPA